MAWAAGDRPVPACMSRIRRAHSRGVPAVLTAAKRRWRAIDGKRRPAASWAGVARAIAVAAAARAPGVRRAQRDGVVAVQATYSPKEMPSGSCRRMPWRSPKRRAARAPTRSSR